MSLVYFMTRAPFCTIGSGEDGADVSVQSWPSSIAEAISDIRTEADFHGMGCEVEVIDFGHSSKLLLVRYQDGDAGDPTVLLFTEERVMQGEAGTRFEDDDGWDR
jgi:hypothetical protein